MDVQRLLDVLWRRKWICLLTVAVTVGIVAVGTLRMTPVYSASTMIRVAQFQDASGYSDLMYATRLINTYTYVLKSRPLLDEVIKRLQLSTPSGELAGQISVQSLTDTELIVITVDSADPQQAADVADALATLLTEQSQTMYSGPGKTAREILQEQIAVVEEKLRADRALLQSLGENTTDETLVAQKEDLTTKIRLQEQTYSMLLNQYDQAQTREALRANSISIVEPALVPGAPSKPRTKLNIALAGVVGLVGGLAMSFLFENLDPGIHSAESLGAATSLTVLGSIPTFGVRRWFRRRTVLLNGEGWSSAGESFRILRSSLIAQPAGTLPKTLLITSAERGAGKSTVVANLATAITQAGRRVVIVDGDVRHPCQHTIFGLRNEQGLSNLIVHLGECVMAAQETSIPGLRVLTSGPLPPNPAELFSQARMGELLAELAKDADIVLLDSPPILGVADTMVLAPIVEAVLLVAARDQTTGRRIQAALQQMAQVGAKVLGLVFNKAKAGDTDRYYSYRSGVQDDVEPAKHMVKATAELMDAALGRSGSAAEGSQDLSAASMGRYRGPRSPQMKRSGTSGGQGTC
jgi:non-specific protein-tyrosine kinase